MSRAIIPQIRIQHETLPEHRKVFNLERFAYFEGASVHANHFENAFDKGGIGELINSRIEIIDAFKNNLEESLVLGQTESSVLKEISDFKSLIQFCDNSDDFCFLSLNNLEQATLAYCDYLIERALNQNDNLGKATAYSNGKQICHITTKILNLSVPLIRFSRLKSIDKRSSKKAVSKSADKILKKDLQKFGSILFDLIGGITKEGITGSLPLRVPIRNGLIKDDELLLYGMLDKTTPIKAAMSPEEYVKVYNPKPRHKTHSPISRAKDHIASCKSRVAPNMDLMQAQRYSIYNYRIQAELKMFIAMTQGNLQPIQDLKREIFDYKPMGDFYQVRKYKNRAGGNVIFEIHKAYRPYFESYLDFRDDFVATYPLKNSDWLFPFFRPPTHNGANELPIYTNSIDSLSFKKRVFVENKWPWINNKDLRGAALNILHQCTGDDDLTAEQASHSVDTFKQNYERPSLHKANIEVTRFWSERDPVRGTDIKVSIIQSQCDYQPQAVEYKPSVVTNPNCISPSGCLWCDKHRDIESFEYIWSLVSFRYLKRIESGLVIFEEVNIYDLVIDRINEKLQWFRDASPEYLGWVNEAELRVDEENDIHPFWNKIIELMESR